MGDDDGMEACLDAAVNNLFSLFLSFIFKELQFKCRNV